MKLKPVPVEPVLTANEGGGRESPVRVDQEQDLEDEDPGEGLTIAERKPKKLAQVRRVLQRFKDHATVDIKNPVKIKEVIRRLDIEQRRKAIKEELKYTDDNENCRNSALPSGKDGKPYRMVFKHKFNDEKHMYRFQARLAT